MGTLRNVYPINVLKGMSVVSLDSGNRLGYIADLFIDPINGVLLGVTLVTSEGTVGGLPPIERLLAVAIARNHQPALLRVPRGKGPHSDQRFERRRAVDRQDREQRFRVRPAAKPPSLAQFQPHRLMVVNLAVVDDGPTPVGSCHRLMAGIRQIDDGQAPVTQRDAVGDQDTAIVGTAVRQLADGANDEALAGRAVGSEIRRDATHAVNRYLATRAAREVNGSRS